MKGINVLFLILFTFQSLFSWSQESQQKVSKDLQSYKNIVFDLRGSRGGNGDVAASYLTALDMIQRLQYPGNITFVIENEYNGEHGKASKILGVLLGQKPVLDGQSLRGGKIQIREVGKLPKDFPPADLYVTLASVAQKGSLGETHFRDQDLSFKTPAGKSMAALNDQAGIPIDQKTVLISQTVLGATENSTRPNGFARRGELRMDTAPAGVAQHELGYYYDSVADGLKDKSPQQIRQTLSSQLGHMPKSEFSSQLSDLVAPGGARVLHGSQLTLAYGTTRTGDVKAQFETYLKGLAEEAGQKKTSFAVVMPSEFTADDVVSSKLGKQIEILNGESAWPKKATPGKIYVIRSGPLPHRIFVGLMALAEAPPVVAGDGALSAAITLEKPFVMTRVGWNAQNIANFSERVQEASHLSADSKKLLTQIFPGDSQNLDLTRALALNEKEHREPFKQASQKIAKLTDQLVGTAEIARNFTGVDAKQGVSVDPDARFGFAYAALSETTSLSEFIKFYTANPDVPLYAQKTWMHDLKSRVETAKQAGILENAELQRLEKMLIKVGTKAGPRTRPEIAWLLEELNFKSKEALKFSLLAAKTAPSFAMRGFFDSEKMKTIIEDPKLLQQLKAAVFEKEIQYSSLGPELMNSGNPVAQKIAVPLLLEEVKQGQNMREISKGVYEGNLDVGAKKAMESLIAHLSPVETEAMLLKIFEHQVIYRPGYPFVDELFTQIKELHGGRPLSDKLIYMYSEYLSRLKPQNAAETIKKQLLTGAGVEKVYLKIFSDQFWYARDPGPQVHGQAAADYLASQDLHANNKIWTVLEDFLKLKTARHAEAVLDFIEKRNGNYPKRLRPQLEKASADSYNDSLRSRFKALAEAASPTPKRPQASKINSRCLVNALQSL